MAPLSWVGQIVFFCFGAILCPSCIGTGTNHASWFPFSLESYPLIRPVSQGSRIWQPEIQMWPAETTFPYTGTLSPSASVEVVSWVPVSLSWISENYKMWTLATNHGCTLYPPGSWVYLGPTAQVHRCITGLLHCTTVVNNCHCLRFLTGPSKHAILYMWRLTQSFRLCSKSSQSGRAVSLSLQTLVQKKPVLCECSVMLIWVVTRTTFVIYM